MTTWVTRPTTGRGRTTIKLYVQSDQESKLEAQGKFLVLLLGDKAHLLTEAISMTHLGLNLGLKEAGEIT